MSVYIDHADKLSMKVLKVANCQTDLSMPVTRVDMLRQNKRFVIRHIDTIVTKSDIV